MKTRLILPVQWSAALLIGLVLGLAFQPMQPAAFPATPTPVAATEPAPSAAPFRTLPGGWLVRVVLHRSAAPEILKVIHLDAARLSAFAPGQYRIDVVDQAGNAMYTQSFEPQFMEGDPPVAVDQKTIIFVLPDIAGAARIVLHTPNGEASYGIPSR